MTENDLELAGFVSWAGPTHTVRFCRPEASLRNVRITTRSFSPHDSGLRWSA